MPKTTPKLESGKFCYTISQMSKDENGYIPVLVVEGDEGFYPMLGNGEFASPWYWGATFDGAMKIAEKVNARMGITPERAAEIIESSFQAQFPSRR